MFKGKFKELKKLGYTFGKFFASDYKAYYIKNSATIEIIIWVKGREIQIDEMNVKTSHAFIELIRNGYNLKNVNHCTYNKETNTFTDYDYKKHDRGHRQIVLAQEKGINLTSKEVNFIDVLEQDYSEELAQINKDAKKYRTYCLSDKLIEKIKELIKYKLI